MIHEQIAVVVSWPVADLQYFAFLINQATVLLTPDELSGICHNRPLGWLSFVVVTCFDFYCYCELDFVF